jgi:hypothetical protein
MRRVLVDPAPAPSLHVLALDRALEALAAIDPRKGRLVKLRELEEA